MTAFLVKVPAVCGIFASTFGENAGSLRPFTRSRVFFHRQRRFLSPAGERFCNRSKALITIASEKFQHRTSVVEGMDERRSPKVANFSVAFNDNRE